MVRASKLAPLEERIPLARGAQPNQFSSIGQAPRVALRVGQPSSSSIMDDTEEAQAWIEAVTHDPFDDSLSFLANLKTGARRGVPAISRAPRRRRPLAGAAVQADQRDQAR